MPIERFLLALVTASPIACGSSQTTVEPPASTVASKPAPPKAEPAAPKPEPAPEQPATTPVPDGCQVLLVMEADGANGQLAGPTTLLARAKNLTTASLELTLEDRCPGGEAAFSGLEPAGGHYDYYHTCNKGVCAGGRPPRVIALPPGELVDISSTQIDPDGQLSCDEPIAIGTYKLSFSLAFAEGSSNPTTCGPEPLELHRK